jgi:hypothetical protein
MIMAVYRIRFNVYEWGDFEVEAQDEGEATEIAFEEWCDNVKNYTVNIEDISEVKDDSRKVNEQNETIEN